MRFVLNNIITHDLILKEFGGLLTSEIWDGQMSAYPYFLEWRVEKCRSDLFVLRTSVSQISSNCLTMTNSGYKRDCIRNRSKREDKDTPCDIGILGYCDIGIIPQVWAALHAVGNRIMWWEGQSAFLMGRSVDRVYIYGFGCTGLSWFLSHHRQVI